jgi:hypothetical protein
VQERFAQHGIVGAQRQLRARAMQLVRELEEREIGWLALRVRDGRVFDVRSLHEPDRKHPPPADGQHRQDSA